MTEKRDSILIVDDERLNINILKDLLETDYDIMIAKTGEQALKRAISTMPPDLILLDIMMPGMDGYQVLRRLKSDNSTCDIPVIFITAMSETVDETRGLELGAVDYITKPISPAIVKARVNTHLALTHSLEIQKQQNGKLAILNDELVDKNNNLLELNKILVDMANVDGLTKIPNRRRFDEYLEQEWHRCLRLDAPLSLILMDIDFFKPFNDNYGHIAGDECLQQVATYLAKAMVRSIDLVARYGGEEFVCVMPDTDIHGLNVMAERFQESISALAWPHAHSSVTNIITLSMGGATMVPTAGHTKEGIIKAADNNLYKAKESGRNRLVS